MMQDSNQLSVSVVLSRSPSFHGLVLSWSIESDKNNGLGEADRVKVQAKYAAITVWNT
jgi:hypothetical protein